jgi:DNA-binding GntR family transcriptional regulator
MEYQHIFYNQGDVMATLISTGTARTTRRKQLPEEVAVYVREQIMSGNLRPGQFLRMEPIAEAVGVSITPVREGLVALSSEGFVTAVPRRGFMVASFTREDVRDLFWAQAQLAGELAARAARRITDDELAQLADIQLRCEAAMSAGDVAAISELGPQFHRMINQAARSERLARLLATMVRQLPSDFYASLEAHADTSAPAHSHIFDAVSQRDAKLARRLTMNHFADSSNVVIKMLAERRLLTESVEER